MKKIGFTLAEVLITLAIIGVVAALTIPSVVANTQQQEFKTGLRKAVSVLNSAITMSMALDGQSPYENSNLYTYLGRHMSVMRSRTFAPMVADETWSNIAFYTTDGMRFEFLDTNSAHMRTVQLIAPDGTKLQFRSSMAGYLTEGFPGKPEALNKEYPFDHEWRNGYCGSYGLANNPDNTTHTPCYIVVDVNGDRKPFPKNAACIQNNCPAADKAKNVRKYSDINGRKLTDSFGIMITDRQAIPYGLAAQKAMYEAQK